MAQPDPAPPPWTGEHQRSVPRRAIDGMRHTVTPARQAEPQPDQLWVDGWALAPYLGAAWRDGLTVVPRQHLVPRTPAPHGQVSRQRGRLMTVLANPLYRSGYALIANVAGTTIVGLGFWAFAAHLYSRQQVGQASALVAALVLVSSFAQLNLNNTLPRFLTQAGRRAGRLIGYGYAASSAAALFIGLAVVIVLPRLSPHWQFLGSSASLSVTFVIGTVVWGVFALQDYALLGLQRSFMVPLENTVYGVAKLLMLLGVASMLPQAGVFVAWVVPLAINVPAVNWLIFHRYLKDWQPAKSVATVRPRDIIRFTSVDYVGNLLSQTAGNLLPLLVLTALGAASAAVFYIAWTITNGLNLVANSFATSLLAEGSANPSRLRELTRGTLARNLFVTGAGAAVFGLGARVILSIYGHGYAVRASVLLGLLAAGSVCYGLLAVVFSVDRIAGHVARATVTRLVVAVLTLGGSWALLPRLGIDGVGVGWLGANLLGALVRIPTIFSAGRVRASTAPVGPVAGTPAAPPGSLVRSRSAGRHRRTTPSSAGAGRLSWSSVRGRGPAGARTRGSAGHARSPVPDNHGQDPFPSPAWPRGVPGPTSLQATSAAFGPPTRAYRPEPSPGGRSLAGRGWHEVSHIQMADELTADLPRPGHA